MDIGLNVALVVTFGVLQLQAPNPLNRLGESNPQEGLWIRLWESANTQGIESPRPCRQCLRERVSECKSTTIKQGDSTVYAGDWLKLITDEECLSPQRGWTWVYLSQAKLAFRQELGDVTQANELTLSVYNKSQLWSDGMFWGTLLLNKRLC